MSADDRAKSTERNDQLRQVRDRIHAARKGASEEELDEALTEYKAGKPLAYITGQHDFGSLSMVIRPPVYIPRIETEQWVLLLAQHVLSQTKGPLRILDICSGSGCIPLLLAKEGGGRITTVGLEVDDRALTVAWDNVRQNKLEQSCTFEKSDLFSGDIDELAHRLGGFDIVVSNPPYVSSADMRKLDGKWHESDYALQGKLAVNDVQDDDGLSFYRRIRQVYLKFLAASRSDLIPKMVLEVGSTQCSSVKAMFEGQGRMVVHKETERRADLNVPSLEQGDMVGTERCLWIY